MSRIENGLDINVIRPDASGRFSPNLYRWLTARGRTNRAGTSNVYRDDLGTLWIGRIDDGYLVGARLISVLCEGARAQSFSFMGVINPRRIDDFWQCYMRVGRCAIDPEHKMGFIGDDARWSVSGERRTCLWCGNASQTLRRWTQAEVVSHERWESAEEAAASA